MAEQKTRSGANKTGLTAKKVPAAKTSSKSAVKPKTTKATLTKTVKKTVAAKPRKTKVVSVKKTAAPAAKRKVAAKIPLDSNIKSTRMKSTNINPAATKKAVQLTPEERYRMVEKAAYYIAERHGFQGRSDEHWAAAELEVLARLGT
ncbi:MAG: DUF2934 domain-containing protein [Gallionella sp.]